MVLCGVCFSRATIRAFLLEEDDARCSERAMQYSSLVLAQVYAIKITVENICFGAKITINEFNDSLMF